MLRRKTTHQIREPESGETETDNPSDQVQANHQDMREEGDGPSKGKREGIEDSEKNRSASETVRGSRRGRQSVFEESHSNRQHAGTTYRQRTGTEQAQNWNQIERDLQGRGTA